MNTEDLFLAFLPYVLENIPPDQNQKWKLIRAERERLLVACDWIQLQDAVLTDAQRTAWQDYRQTLRNIPQDFTNPDDVTFPSRPASRRHEPAPAAVMSSFTWIRRS